MRRCVQADGVLRSALRATRRRTFRVRPPVLARRRFLPDMAGWHVDGMAAVPFLVERARGKTGTLPTPRVVRLVPSRFGRRVRVAGLGAPIVLLGARLPMASRRARRLLGWH